MSYVAGIIVSGYSKALLFWADVKTVVPIECCCGCCHMLLLLNGVVAAVNASECCYCAMLLLAAHKCYANKWPLACTWPCVMLCGLLHPPSPTACWTLPNREYISWDLPCWLLGCYPTCRIAKTTCCLEDEPQHTNCSGVYGSRSVKHKALRAQMQFFANSSKKKRYERLAKLAPWTAGTMRLLWCPLCFASFPDALALVMMRFFRFVTPLW